MTRVCKPRHARRAIGSVAVVVCTLLLTFSVVAQTKRQPRRAPGPKTSVATAINAEEMQRLLRLDGSRPLLVNFWATWCIPCRAEFPDLVKIDRTYRKKGLDFIAITLDDFSDLNTTVPKFLREMKATMPVYLLNERDPDPAISSVDAAWGGVLPATFLYNSKGQIVYKHFGPIKTTELRSAIGKVLSTE